MKTQSYDANNLDNAKTNYIIDSHKIDIWGTGIDEIQEKAPSNRKKS